MDLFFSIFNQLSTSDYYRAGYNPRYAHLTVDYRHGNYISDPRMKEILEEIGLDEFWKEFGWPKICQPVGDNDFKCEFLAD